MSANRKNSPAVEMPIGNAVNDKTDKLITIHTPAPMTLAAVRGS